MSPRPAGKILYVDDETTNRKVFAANFEDVFQLELADSGQAALALLEETEVAIVLADERMPVMRGSELLTLVKERWPDTLRMVVTAYSDVQAVVTAVNKGEVWRYVLKPWNTAELRQLIENGLEIYRLTRERTALQVNLMLAERRAIVGLLAGSVGHELRNALNVSLNTADTVAGGARALAGLLDAARQTSGLPPRLGAEVKRVAALDDVLELEPGLDALQGSLHQMKEIAASMVDGVRARPANPKPVDLAALLERDARLFDQEVRRTGSRLHVDVEPGLVGEADVVALRQIVWNLVLNGAQAIPEERRPGLVFLRLRSDGDRALVEVEDNGTGIPRDVMKRLFEPLFTTKGAAGTGLGLAVSRTLAEQMGGTLTVKSRAGEGATFTLSLKRMRP